MLEEVALVVLELVPELELVETVDYEENEDDVRVDVVVEIVVRVEKVPGCLAEEIEVEVENEYCVGIAGKTVCC